MSPLLCPVIFSCLMVAAMIIILFNQPIKSGYGGANCPNKTCDGGSLTYGMSDNTIHDYIFNATAGDKIWRGFILGCAVGLFVAALFCCWAPCFRLGARGAVARAWRFPRRAVADAEGQRRPGLRYVFPPDQGVEGGEMGGARQDPPSGRFVDQATLISVRGSN